jgi:ATP-dependent Clp protease ATP-binding subunit ClpB
LKNELTSKPLILDEIDRRIIQLEMERLSLKSDYENDEEANKSEVGKEGARLSKIDLQLNDLKNQSEELSMKWMAEKGGVDRLKDLKEQIAQINLEIEKSERVFDLNRAAELKYSKLPALEQELAKIDALAEAGTDNDVERMLRDEVVAEDIAAVVAVWTGIPSSKLMETERDRILNMGDKLRERVIGQDDAIQVITEAVQRSRAGLNDPTKPIASLIFLGPTGVGEFQPLSWISQKLNFCSLTYLCLI